MTAPHDTHDTAPAQPCPRWRLVLSDGRVVVLDVSSFHGEWVVKEAGKHRAASGNHYQDTAIHYAARCIAREYNSALREIVPPGQLTAAERVAAERRNSEAREEAAYLRGLNDACAECDRQLRVCADSGHADAITEAESRGAERERAAVVAWLRERSGECERLYKESRDDGAGDAVYGRSQEADYSAGAIERGEHRKGGE